MRNRIISIILILISFTTLNAQEFSDPEGKGFDINLTYHNADFDYWNPLIKYNFGMNRIGAGFILADEKVPSESKIIGESIVYDRIIVFKKHFNSYFEIGFSSYVFKQWYDYTSINYIQVNALYGLRYYPFGQCIYFCYEAGLYYRIEDQSINQNMDIYINQRFGFGVLLYRRKY